MDVFVLSFVQQILEYNQGLSLGAVSNVTSIIADFTSALRTIATPLAALALIIAGIMWFTMGEQGPARAKKLILGALIGLAIVFTADALANWIENQSTF